MTATAAIFEPTIAVDPAKAQTTLNNIITEQKNLIEKLNDFGEWSRSLASVTVHTALDNACLQGGALQKDIAAIGLDAVGDFCEKMRDIHNEWKVKHATAAATVTYARPTGFTPANVKAECSTNILVFSNTTAKTIKALGDDKDPILKALKNMAAEIEKTKEYWLGLTPIAMRAVFAGKMADRTPAIEKGINQYVLLLRILESDLEHRDQFS